VNAKRNDGRTALMIASERGHKEVVKLLLEKGADVNAKNKEGMTALKYASENGHKEIVELLKSYGAEE
jgi:serine/threonine-protein phosphatase 6 regulatory ankyrin repeat subunit B